jgi:hypothetical protein
MTSAGQMLLGRLQLPQSLSRQLRCHGITVRFATSETSKKSSTDSSSSSSSTPSSSPLFNRLFSEKPAANGVRTRPPRRSPAPEQSSLEHTRTRNPTPTREPKRAPLPLGDELRAWLENAVSEVRRSSKREAGPTVLVLSNASRSLLESDFYRLAPQGQHVDGWAGAITKG